MDALYAQAVDIQSLVSSEFFTYILPFLFVFAVVYGILTGASIPKSSSARSVISLVIAFAILPVAPFIAGSLTRLGMGFVIVVAGLLVFIILIELMGIRSSKRVKGVDRQGNPVEQDVPVSIFEAHGRSFAVLVIIIAAILFASTGGFELLGISGININPGQYPLLFFLGVIALIVWWLTAADRKD